MACSSRADRPFAFQHRWAVPLPPGAAMDLLGDPSRYPEWWPAIRGVRRIDDGTPPGAPGERVRILLLGLVPVRLVMERQTDDRERGVLMARLHGDLEGTVRVDVRGGGAGGEEAHCLVAWTQEVRIASRWMRALALAPGARAAMRASHAAAMRAGRRSLHATALPTG